MRKFPLIAFLLILLTTACTVAVTSAGETGTGVGSRAPAFELESLSGGMLGLDDFRGEVILINFWATWCGPCRLEMPAIQQRYEDTDLVVLAVNFDEPRDQVQDYIDELSLSFPVLLDPGGAIQLLYQIRGYPTTYFVDEEGIIQIVHIGFMADEQLDGYMSDMGLLR